MKFTRTEEVQHMKRCQASTPEFVLGLTQGRRVSRVRFPRGVLLHTATITMNA